MPTRTTLDPKLDVVFALLFGAERNRDTLIALLNAILRPTIPIVAVEVLSERPEPIGIDDKNIVLDLRARLANGEQVNVEMQSRGRDAERQRALYYWARLYCDKLKRGDAYGELRPAVVIIITNFRMLRSPQYHSIFHVLEETTHEPLTTDFELHVLELPKLHQASAESPEQSAIRWGKFLRAETDEELAEIAMTDPALQKAMQALEELSADPKARILAERREMGLRLYHNDLAVANAKGVAEGKAQGVAEGKAQGVAEGKAQGVAEGYAQAILSLLGVRGITLDADQSEHIRSCRDATQLETWLHRATSATTAAQLFD